MGVRSCVSSISCANMLLDQIPIFSMDSKSFKEQIVFFSCPSSCTVFWFFALIFLVYFFFISIFASSFLFSLFLFLFLFFLLSFFNFAGRFPIILCFIAFAFLALFIIILRISHRSIALAILDDILTVIINSFTEVVSKDIKIEIYFRVYISFLRFILTNFILSICHQICPPTTVILARIPSALLLLNRSWSTSQHLYRRRIINLLCLMDIVAWRLQKLDRLYSRYSGSILAKLGITPSNSCLCIKSSLAIGHCLCLKLLILVLRLSLLL